MRVIPLLLAFLCTPVLAGTISLEWDEVTGCINDQGAPVTCDGPLAGYEIYYGDGGSGQYTLRQRVAVAVTQSVVYVEDCKPWYLAVKTLRHASAEEIENGEDEGGFIYSVDYSNEIEGASAPSIAGAWPRSIKTNKLADVTLRGHSFIGPVTVEIPGAVVSNVQVVDCQALTFTVDPRGAPVGEAIVTVTRADGILGAANVIEFYRGSAPPAPPTLRRQ
jgi:hypothetical protein